MAKRISLIILSIFILFTLFPLFPLVTEAARLVNTPQHGLDPAQISLPKKQGTLLNIRGETNVSGNSGELKYHYPIPIPKWRGLYKSLELVYSSMTGNTVYGYGFSLTVPRIIRSKRFGVPTASSPIESVDGELVKVGELDGNAVYLARIEQNFTRYLIKNDIITAQTKDGFTYIYGKSESSKEGKDRITVTWNLSQIIDDFGNQVIFTYHLQNGVSEIQEISFVEQNGELTYKIKFDYQIRNDDWISYRNGFLQHYKHRLTTITGFWHQSRMFKVLLTYQEAGISNRSLLTKIQRFGNSDLDYVPPLHFSYSNQEISSFELTYQQKINLAMNGKSARWIDYNGDGLADLLGRSSDDTWVYWPNLGLNQGLGDPVLLKNQRFVLRQYQESLVDFNGDRLVDYVRPSGASRRIDEKGIKVHLNNRYNNFQWDVSPTFVAGINHSNLSSPKVGTWVDLNADSRVDYVKYGIGKLTIIPNRSYFEELSFGDPIRSRGKQLPRAFGNPTSRRHVWSDINGDGLPDIGYHDRFKRRFVFNLNIGDFSFGETRYLKLSGNYAFAHFQLMDINGDGLPDVFAWKPISGLGLIYLNNGKDFELTQTILRNDALKYNPLIAFGDFNGNGSNDILVLSLKKVYYYDPYITHEVKQPFLLQRVFSDDGQENLYSYSSSVDSYDPADMQNRMPITHHIIEEIKQKAVTTGIKGEIKYRKTHHESFAFAKGYYDHQRNTFLGYELVVNDRFHTAEDDFDTRTDKGTRIETTYYTYANGSNNIQTTAKGLLRGLLRGLVKKRIYRRLSDLKTKPERFFRMEETPHGVKLLDNDPLSNGPLTNDTGHFWPYIIKNKVTRIDVNGRSQVSLNSYHTEFFEDLQVPKVQQEIHHNADLTIYRRIRTTYLKPDQQNWRVLLPESIVVYGEDESNESDESRGKILQGQSYTYYNNTSRIESVARYLKQRWQTFRTFQFDEYGNVFVITSANGHSTRIDYEDDGHFMPTSVTSWPQNKKALPLKKHFQYDHLAGEKIKRYQDENGFEYHLEYDGLGRLNSWRNPQGGEYRYTYEWGKYNWESEDILSLTNIQSSTVGIAVKTVTFYDGLGRDLGTIFVNDTGSNVLQKLQVYNLAGNVTIKSNPQQLDQSSLIGAKLNPELFHRFAFDEQGRRIWHMLPNADCRQLDCVVQGTKGINTWEHTLNTIYFSNAEGEVRQTSFDHFNRVKSIIETNSARNVAQEVEISVEYDKLNNISLMRLPGVIRQFKYDEVGRLIQVNSPEVGEIKWHYKPTDELFAVQYFARPSDKAFDSNKVYESNKVSNMMYAYDKLGRVVEQRVSKGRSLVWDKGRSVYQYRYDDAVSPLKYQTNLKGRLSELNIIGEGLYRYGYDSLGNLRMESLLQDNTDITMHFAYDHLSRLTKVTYPDKEIVSYNYSPQSGLLRQVERIADQINYDSLMRVESIRSQEGFSLTNVYTPITNQIEERNYNSPTGMVVGYQYQYDHQKRFNEISYHGLGQIQFKVPHKDIHYDARGQLLSVNNQLYQYRNNGDFLGQVALPKDAWGRVIQGPDYQIKWNEENRVVELTAGGQKLQFAYKPDGSRLSKTVGNNKTTYFNPYLHYDHQQQSFTKYYLIGGKRWARRKDSESLKYFVRDHLGSIQALVDSNGQVSSRYYYDSYGASTGTGATGIGTGTGTGVGIGIGNTNAQDSVFGFTGSFFDSESGLNQMGVRYYDPRLGRFLSPDLYMLQNPEKVLGSPIEGNLYSYAKNDPVNYVDPSGQFACGGLCILGVASAAYTVYSEYKLHQYSKVAAKWDVSSGRPEPGIVSDPVGETLVGMFVGKAAGSVGKSVANKLSSPKSIPMGEAHNAASYQKFKMQLTAEEISAGHAFEKHVIQRSEFPGITTRKQFSDHIENVLKSPTHSKKLGGGRSAAYSETSNTVVIKNPKTPDGGTAFKPETGVDYFNKALN